VGGERGEGGWRGVLCCAWRKDLMSDVGRKVSALLGRGVYGYLVRKKRLVSEILCFLSVA
jgi:hypothetical protein